jgi:release factor glutamine methyltransferase
VIRGRSDGDEAAAAGSAPAPPVLLLASGAARLAAAGIPADEARTEARRLLSHASGRSHTDLLLRPADPLSAAEMDAYDILLARRCLREPLPYITGERDFYGLTFHVTPAVLIPRPETEFLVEAVLDAIAAVRAPRVVDVGTGSGILAIAVAVRRPDARVWATDISADALAVAGLNAARHGVADRVTPRHGDLLSPVHGDGPFHAIASNPPYIAPDEIRVLEPEVRDWEPRIALGTNPDALHFYRRFAAEAPELLATGGLLAVEVGAGQAAAVADLWRGAAGLAEVAVVDDYAGIGRVVTGHR